MTEPIEVAALLPCPFCGLPLTHGSRKINPHARCTTEGCFGKKMPVVSPDVPNDVDAWNRRPAASGDLPTSGHGYEGEFTAREFFERSFDHDKAARNGLSAGPNVSYVRTFQACAAALRYAAENMFKKDDASLPGRDDEAIRAEERGRCAAEVEWEGYATTGRQIATRIRTLKTERGLTLPENRAEPAKPETVSRFTDEIRGFLDRLDEQAGRAALAQQGGRET